MSILTFDEEISAKTGASIADVIVPGGYVGIEQARGVSLDFTSGQEAQHRSKLILSHLKSLNHFWTGFVII